LKFYTSDLHLSHKKIIEYEKRPFSSVEEMNDHLIENWNRKVKSGDEVYILGDFAFCKGNEANELLKRLNGQKFLIRGNHDRFVDDKDFDTSLFKLVRHYATTKDGGNPVIMFHYPIAVWDRQHYGSIHLYGHVHANKSGHYPLRSKLKNAYNVGVDVCDYEPKTLAELTAKTNW